MSTIGNHIDVRQRRFQEPIEGMHMFCGTARREGIMSRYIRPLAAGEKRAVCHQAPHLLRCTHTEPAANHCSQLTSHSAPSALYLIISIRQMYNKSITYLNYRINKRYYDGHHDTGKQLIISRKGKIYFALLHYLLNN